jgi:hypothetical protein
MYSETVTVVSISLESTAQNDKTTVSQWLPIQLVQSLGLSHSSNGLLSGTALPSSRWPLFIV